MSTLVCFHAHPDDEALSTGGMMAKAAAAGHRVVLVTATRGEQGEPVPGVLADGELLWERRVQELAESAALLGADEPRLLGYEDSGMIGEPANDNPACFWQANVETAAEKLAAILAEVSADVLTIYDDHGLYGHPDHIQVHRVGLRAAELAGTEYVYEASVNRDQALKRFAEMEQVLEGAADGPSPDEMENFGLPEAELAYVIDISEHLGAKRAAMVVHRSQIPDDSFFLQLPDEVFRSMFAHEWFAIPESRRSSQPAPNYTGDGPQPAELLPGL